MTANGVSGLVRFSDKTGVSAGGDSNLVKIRFGPGRATLYDFRSNGDIAVATLGDNGNPCWWDLYPIGSRERVTIATEECYSASSRLERLAGTIEYLGEEDIITPAGRFATHSTC